MTASGAIDSVHLLAGHEIENVSGSFREFIAFSASLQSLVKRFQEDPLLMNPELSDCPRQITRIVLLPIFGSYRDRLQKVLEESWVTDRSN